MNVRLLETGKVREESRSRVYVCVSVQACSVCWYVCVYAQVCCVHVCDYVGVRCVLVLVLVCVCVWCVLISCAPGLHVCPVYMRGRQGAHVCAECSGCSLTCGLRAQLGHSGSR